MQRLLCYISLSCALLIPANHAYGLEVKSRANHVVAGILVEIPGYIQTTNLKLSNLCIGDAAELTKFAKDRNATKKSYNHINPISTTSSLSDCSIVYTENKRHARRLLARKSTNSLTISNYSTFIDEGGIIAILEDNGKIAIELNIGAAKHHGITFNPDLIEISTRVIQ